MVNLKHSLLRAACRRTGLAVALIAGTMAAQPALANSSNADIAAPLRAAQAAGVPQPAADREFAQLFASWRALDGGMHGNGFVTAARGSTAFGTAGLGVIGGVPSRTPVEGYRLTSGFGMRWHPVLGGRREHKGLDLAAPMGTPIHATADGMVGRAEWFSGYGLYVALEHGQSIETRYGHMSRLNVAAGQAVHKGDVIGYVGATGRATGPHLHYEVRVAGEAVDPMPYLQGQGEAPMSTEGRTRLAQAGEGDSGDE